MTREQYKGVDGVVIEADLDQAAAPVLYSTDGGSTFEATPFQTADCGHDKSRLLGLVDAWLESEAG